MGDREAGNWLSAYLTYTYESESPDVYHIWIGLACLASVVRRNVFLDQGIYVLYPNQYIALVGPPGKTGKTTAIRLGSRLIQNIPGVIMGPDACSREQLIRAMATSKYNGECCMTIHSGEFSSLIDTSGTLMIKFLMDLYDCYYHSAKGWRYETKTQGKDEIIKPCLNMLVGTTTSYLAESMPQNVIGHGFTSRTMFVYAEEPRKENPYPKNAPKDLIQALVDDLHHISGVYGEFRWDCDEEDHNQFLDPHGNPLPDKAIPETHVNCGRKAYQTFYHKLFISSPGDHRLEGYHWRKKVHILKVAMLLSLAERNECILDALVINKAGQLLADLEADMARTFSAVGKYEHATDLERIGSSVIQAGGMSVAEVYKRNYFVGDDIQLRRIIAQLSSMGAIKLTMKDGKEWLTPGGDSLPWE